MLVVNTHCVAFLFLFWGIEESLGSVVRCGFCIMYYEDEDEDELYLSCIGVDCLV